MLVAIRRAFGKDDAAIRAGAVADLKEAFAAAEVFVRPLRVGEASETEPFTTTAGIYRLVMDHHGVDRSDASLQETWLAWVQEALDEALLGPGGRPPPAGRGAP